jgi:(S)-sulfolactate dehydrogenase
MTAPDIVITEFMDDAAVAGLAADFPVHYDPGLVDRRTELLAALASARGLIVRNRTQVDTELLDAAPQLVAVGRLGVGLDNIDVAACEARGVSVWPASGANAAAVAEYVIAALLTLFRRAFMSSDRVAAGEWPRTELAGREIAGKRLGLVGFGGIARLVAEKAAALGMEVAAYDPLIEATDAAWGMAIRWPTLDELLAHSDAISLHVPLAAGTRNLLDAAALGKLPKGAIVVNTSRGGVLDEDALVTALRADRLGGAALDVFAVEPVDAAAGARFRDVPNLLLTPHIAGITDESNRRVGAVTAAAIRRALEGTRS